MALSGAVEARRGLFTTRQAERAGYSPQLLNHHARAGRIQRLRRGVFRLVHFPPSDEEPLVEIWLWADRKAVFSHQTALSRHDLSDALPHRVHVTLPTSWSNRRLRVPVGVVLHHRPVSRRALAWVGVLKVTTPERTIEDCIEDHVSPEWVAQAIEQAKARGLVPPPRRARALRRAREMKPRAYKTPEAFKAAVDQRLRQLVGSGPAITRRRQMLVFDRFLARIREAFGEGAVLKGGLVLEVRLERARTTRDWRRSPRSAGNRSR